MLNVRRALTLNADSGKPLPRVEAFGALYSSGTTPRHGEVVMIVGRSGSQKSGAALFWVDEMNLPTLYFSADMSAFTASSRIACKRSGRPTAEVEAIMETDCTERDELLALVDQSNIQFSFGAPISFRKVDQELDAWVELHDAYPEVIVFDNLLDFEGAESDYAAQMEVMALVTELARDTGATVMILHHASDKSWDAKSDPFNPPSRAEVKGGMSEKPELTLSVALDPYTLDFKIATIKQRMGKCDPTGRTFVTVKCEPELTRFHRKGVINYNRV